MRFPKESVIAGIGLPVARNGKVPKMNASRKFFIRFVYLLKERVSL